MIETIKQIDIWLFLLFNRNIANPFFDFIFVTITNGKFWIIPSIIGAVFFIKFKKKTAFIVIAMALVTVSVSDPLCVRVFKPLFHRLRPCDPAVLLEGGRFLLGHKTSLSFPSAHACNIFSQAMLFRCFFPRYSFAFFCFASVIAFSRVYVGVHYPMDVIGGAVLGIGIGAFIFWLYCIINKNIQSKIASIREKQRKSEVPPPEAVALVPHHRHGTEKRHDSAVA